MIAGLPKYLNISGTRIGCLFSVHKEKEIINIENSIKEGMDLLTQIKHFLSDESGQGMVEYGLILALVAIVVIAVFFGIGR